MDQPRRRPGVALSSTTTPPECALLSFVCRIEGALTRAALSATSLLHCEAVAGRVLTVGLPCGCRRSHSLFYSTPCFRYHMWASEILNHCGIHRWVSNSVVVHAVSHSATGSFTRQEVVWPLFTHEPTAARAPDGSYVLFVTHHDGPPIAPSQHTCNCTDGTSASGGCNQEIGNCNNGTGCAMYTFMSYASNPAGPWSPLQSLAHMQVRLSPR